MPMPEAQPTMPSAEVDAPPTGLQPSAPAPAVPVFLLAGLAAVGAAVLVVAVWRRRPGRPRN
jgi:hypothetical protein